MAKNNHVHTKGFAKKINKSSSKTLFERYRELKMSIAFEVSGSVMDTIDELLLVEAELAKREAIENTLAN